MKTSFFLAVLIIIDFGRKAKGNVPFECPINCPANVYKPVCVRGKSYVNLCVLKRDICDGKTPEEFYKDVEACPGYETADDANGASVEMIDKNGVIFRRLTDDSDQTEAPERTLHHSTESIARTRKPDTPRRDPRCQRQKRKPICPETCSNPRETKRHSACENRNLCSTKFRNRRCWDALNKLIISF